MTRVCSSCGERIPAEARFCRFCGDASPAVHREHARVRDASHFETIAASRAVAVVFGGCLGGLVLAAMLFPEGPPGPALLAFIAALDVAIGLIGASLIGFDGAARSLRAPCSGRHLVEGVGVGGAMIAVALAYVSALSLITDDATVAERPDVWTALHVVVLAPLLEEWLCRGVLWAACERIVRPRAVIVVTAALFAMLHLVNGGYVLELPHRFVAGLLLGWMRARSGSIWPGTVAHFLNNLVAVVLASA